MKSKEDEERSAGKTGRILGRVKTWESGTSMSFTMEAVTITSNPVKRIKNKDFIQ